MVKKLCSLFLLFTTITCFAQKPAYDFKAAELKSREIVFRAPDSALTIIKTTLAQKGKLHDTIYGNSYTLYGLYYSVTGKPDSSLYYFKKSLTYLGKYPKNRTRTIVNMATMYRNTGDYQTSIKYLGEAMEAYKKDKNKVGTAIVYGSLGANYNILQEDKKAIDNLLKAIAILKDEKDIKHILPIKLNLANTYLRTRNFKFAKDLYKECLTGFKTIGSYRNYYLTHVNLAEALIHLEEFNDAKKSLFEAAEGLGKFGDIELVGVSYSKIGNIERLKKQYPQAMDAYKKAMDAMLAKNSMYTVRIAAEYISLLNHQKQYAPALAIIPKVDSYLKSDIANAEDRMMYYTAIAETYSKTNYDKKAIEAYNSTIILRDSISIRDKENAIEEVQAKFQTELQREKNLSLEASNNTLQKEIETEKRMMLLYIIISVALIIIILAFLRGYWLRNRLQNAELKTIETEKDLIKQQHLLEQERANAQKEIIEEKQRELTSLALRMANYQDNLNGIIEKCDSNIFSKASDVKKELQQLVKRKDYWKQFETRFNRLHPEFNNNLTNRFSKLTKNDIEFCSLLKLNLSNKEIASLLQISHESAITKKYRIKKKMEISDDTEFEKLLNEM